MNQANILVVEDDADINRLLCTHPGGSGLFLPLRVFR